MKRNSIFTSILDFLEEEKSSEPVRFLPAIYWLGNLLQEANLNTENMYRPLVYQNQMKYTDLDLSVICKE